jgi:Mrp family chromosome partitioning ATPase
MPYNNLEVSMIEKEVFNEKSSAKKIIGVMSGKGGVGKSSVTSLIATTLCDAGYKVGIMDADITGPSIPRIFGISTKRAVGDENGVSPVESVKGIKVMSVNLIIDDETAPVVWRGPLIANSVKQFYTDVNWGVLDYLLIDLPPGTGDVPLTIMQSFDIDGVVVVTSPQDLVSMIVKKSINMAKMLKVPVYGLVENMSFYQCTHCNEKIHVFGESKIHKVAKEMKIPLIAQIPIDTEFVKLCDEGKVELYNKINYKFADEFRENITKVF